MKFLDAKRNRPPVREPAGGGPSADEMNPSASEKAPTGSPVRSGHSGESKVETDLTTRVQKANVTAAAAKLAEGWGLDLARIQGTGADGRITTSDVVDAHDRATSPQE